MERSVQLGLKALVIAALTLLAGCQSTYWAAPPQGAQQVDPYDSNRFRALALTTGPLASLRSPEQESEEHWYDFRNDVRLATYSGYVGPVYEESVIFTYDRQWTAGNHVYDSYSSTNYRITQQQSER